MIDLKEILEKMNLNQKINYDKVMMKMVQNWQTAGIRPKILLHACCAPCSTTTLERMTEFAEVTIYYANSNIHPRAEYQRREYVQQKLFTISTKKQAITFNLLLHHIGRRNTLKP